MDRQQQEQQYPQSESTVESELVAAESHDSVIDSTIDADYSNFLQHHLHYHFSNVDDDYDRDYDRFLLSLASSPPLFEVATADEVNINVNVTVTEFKLPLVEVKNEEGSVIKTACAICHDDFVEGTTVNRLPCDHYFHVDCISSWLRIRNTCPLCRSQLN